MSANNSAHVKYLDGWRGCAIILVLIGHFGPHEFERCGGVGVLLFFVLSGFFMGNLLFVKKVPLRTFFARRVTRIVPTLWVFVTAMYVYARFLQPELYAVPLDELLSNYLFLGTYAPSSTSIWSLTWPNGHLWSLNIEEHSYIYLGVGALLVKSFPGIVTRMRFLLGSVIAIMAIICLYKLHRITGYGSSPWYVRSEVASLGLVAAAAYVTLWNKKWEIWWNRSPLVPIMCVVLAAAGFVRYNENYCLLIAPILAAIAVNHATNFPEALKRVLSSKVPCWFGTCSFSIYLWQHPFYALADKFGYSAAVCLTLAIVSGAASFYVIENPARIYFNRLWQNYEDGRSIKLGIVV